MPQRLLFGRYSVSVKVRLLTVMSLDSAPAAALGWVLAHGLFLAANDAGSDHHPGEDGRIGGEQQAAVAHDGDVQGPCSGAVGQCRPLELELAFSFFKGRPGESGPRSEDQGWPARYAR